MTTSTPPAWRWLDECSVPIQVYQYPTSETPSEMCRNYREAALSIYSRNLPDSATLREQNDSGTEPEVSSSTTKKLDTDQCANGEQCTPSALIPSDQCPECRSAPGRPHATGCEDTAQLTDSVSNVAPSHRIGTCYLDPDTGETVMPADFFGEKELRWKTDKDGNLDDEPSLVKVDSCPEGSTWADIEYEDEGPSVPLWTQALWLARHIEDIRSPRPDVVSDDELRGMTLIRVLGIGAEEHGDEVFGKTHRELARDRAEEWSDAEFYDLVDRLGDELSPATASQDEDTALCGKAGLVTSVHS